jgi:DNA oxidative demethylase
MVASIPLFSSSQAVQLKPDVWLFERAVDSQALRVAIDQVTAQAPLRHLQVASGQTMSAAMTNCGELGWYSDTKGYRYQTIDPVSGKPWPIMPELFTQTARQFAQLGGWADFEPDACLINRYEAKARMGLHQDRDERQMNWPIVSVSLGASCQFLIGGLSRKHPAQKCTLHDGDVIVWGGSARLMFHGVAPLVVTEKAPVRYNLTFRKAG